MKKIKLHLFIMLLSIFGFSQMAFAVTETEPNNAWNQSKNIPLGQSGTGTCAAGGDIDWWKVTITGDGTLNINLAPTSGSYYMHCELYDTLGNLQLAQNYSYVPFNISRPDLAAGTYYVQVYMNTASQTDGYTVTPTFTASPVANDIEPNDTKANAQTLALNDSSTGHCGYYFNNKRDSADWWKVVTNKDGDLSITLAPQVGSYTHCELYDNNGTILLTQSYSYVSFTITQPGLAKGTYFVKVYMNNSSQYTPYKIYSNLALPPVVNDVEPNDTKATALVLNLNDSAVGHVGYYYNNKRDTTDWYKVTTNSDGDLSVTLSPLIGYYTWCYLYDNDGTTLLKSSYSYAPFTITKTGLAPGTYYIKVLMNNNGQYAPYKISNDLALPGINNDNASNDSRATAQTFALNGSTAGHCGYYYNNVRDTADWYKITTNADGDLSVTLTPLLGVYTWVYIYDNDGISVLKGNYSYASFTITATGVAKGTYYVKVVMNNSDQYTAYSLSNNLATTVPNDVEPNDSKATAQAISQTDSITGHIGYYYKHARDTADWFKITTTSDGALSLTLYPVLGKYTWIYLYDNDGTTLLASNYSYAPFTITRNDLGKGTYYVKVIANNSGEFNSYSLKSVLNYNPSSDAEPNDYAKTGQKINGYTTKTGGINYLYSGVKDATDWFRLGYYNLGNLDITVTKYQHTFDANYPDILYRLYKDTTLAALDSVQLVGGTLTYNHVYTGLATATYYIRITPLNNTLGGYSIKANYKDTTSQTVTLVSDVAGTTCGAGALTYYITRGKPPYSVQLYKDGVATGAAVNTSDTAKFTSLDAGYYSVTTRSTTAATYTVASKDTTVVPKPVGLVSTSVTTTSAILKWTGLPCVDGYKLQWRLKGTTAWTTIYQPAGATQDTIYGLTASTQYQFRITAYVLYTGNTKYYGLPSTVKTFTTPAVRFADGNSVDVSISELEVYPNPANDKINFVVDDASPVISITITNALGQDVKASNANNEIYHSVDVSSLQRGVYFITIKTSTNLYTSRFVKE